MKVRMFLVDDDFLTEPVLEFAVFCIENVAGQLAVGGEEIYKRLTRDSDILDSESLDKIADISCKTTV